LHPETIVSRHFNSNSFRVHSSDIEQPLTGRNLIKPTDLFPKQAKDFDLHRVGALKEVVDCILHRDADAMNPFQELKHPPQRRPLRRLIDLVRYGFVLTGSLLA
jgi:hypothetical protein